MSGKGARLPTRAPHFFNTGCPTAILRITGNLSQTDRPLGRAVLVVVGVERARVTRDTETCLVLPTTGKSFPPTVQLCTPTIINQPKRYPGGRMTSA